MNNSNDYCLITKEQFLILVVQGSGLSRGYASR